MRYLVILASCILAALSANAYDFTLSVFGNANMDDIIDNNDIAYVQGIIDSSNGATDLADANCDGHIDENDVNQIESIISGKAVELTLIDNEGVTVTLNAPVDSVATLFLGALRPVIHLKAIDKIIGVGSNTLARPDNVVELHAHPELRGLPGIGTTSDPSKETIVSLKPDAIFGTLHTDKETSKAVSQSTGIPFVYANPSKEVFREENGAFETWRLLSLILGKDEQKRSEELIDYCDEKINEIVEVVSEVPDEDKTRVYIACTSKSGITSTANVYEPIEIAGGKNVAEGMAGSDSWGHVDVSKEQIIDWDPEIILITCYSKENWITVDEVLSDPALQTVSAVKNKQVYNTKGWYAGWDPATGLCECLYMAKLFYPEKFEDLDVEAECNEVLEEFYGVSGLYDWMLENCGDYCTWK
ncbi:MAG: ABC transporter substrate-binding protein [Methanotrichaceae archaeon]|nr:ABC transporter substrate-binding protein [Methanotrichaceae archaeon]